VGIMRKALGADNHDNQTDFSDFKTADEALGKKLRPQVYLLRFLKE
jgi:hypothetical protein